MNTLQQLLGRTKSKAVEAMLERKLPRSVVTHDSIDSMQRKNYVADSPKFKRLAVDEAPQIPANVEDPPPIDFTEATPEEIREWQATAREVKAAREEAPPYGAWADLTADVFYSYHTYEHPELIEQVDPGVELHKRILPKLMVTDDHAQTRNITRDDATMSALATMACVEKLRETLSEELLEQARQMQEHERQRQEAQSQQESLDDMRAEARERHEAGQPVPQELVDSIKGAVQQQRQAIAAAQQIEENPIPMTSQAAEAIAAAAQAGQQAAEAAKALPSFGSGLGEGEPVYTSPEQALSIAERWANEPDLREMASLFGRLDKDIRFKRARRVVGGNDEIVDIEFGDNLSRVIPAEMALLSDDELEDDFLARYASGELLQFSTVGEALAGRGPILIVLDGSASMRGDRNVWARATAMCLLHIARLEHRDFGCIEFSASGQLKDWIMYAKRPLDAEAIIDMASHMFSGGTQPIQGVARAAEVMKAAAPFKTADIVLVGDGDAPFGKEDEKLRDQLLALGVRLFGIGVGELTGHRGSYLNRYCEYVVDVHDFDLTDPSQATAELATYVS